MNVSRKTRYQLNDELLSTEHLSSSLGQRAAAGSALALVSQGIRLVVQLMGTAILSRLLEPADFGLVAMGMAVTALVTMFTDLGLSMYIIQKKELNQDTVSGIFFLNIFMGIVVMIAAISLAPLAAKMFGDSRVFTLVLVMSLMIPVGATAAVHTALLRRRMEWKKIEIIGVLTHAIGFTTAVTLAYTTDIGYWSLVANGWAVTISFVILIWLFSPWRPNFVKQWNGTVDALRFGVYLSGFGFIDYFRSQADNVFVGSRFGAEMLGYYNRAYALFMLPVTALIWPTNGVATSTLSRSKDNFLRYQKIFDAMLLPLTLAASLMSGAAYFFAENVINLVYGDQWQESIKLFQILCLTWPIQPMLVTQSWAYLSTGRSRQMLIAGFLSAIAYIAAFAIASTISVQAVAIAFLVTSYLLLTPLVFLMANHQTLSFSRYLFVHFPIPACALVSIFVVAFQLEYQTNYDLGGAFYRTVAFLFIFLLLLAITIFANGKLKNILNVIVVFIRNRVSSHNAE